MECGEARDVAQAVARRREGHARGDNELIELRLANALRGRAVQEA